MAVGRVSSCVNVCECVILSLSFVSLSLSLSLSLGHTYCDTRRVSLNLLTRLAVIGVANFRRIPVQWVNHLVGHLF